MKRVSRALLGVAGLAVIGLLASKFVPWVFTDGPIAQPAEVRPDHPAAKSTTAAAARPAATGERSTLADTLNSPATDIRADLRVVADLVEGFRSNFPQAGNPVGNNPEITAALTGKNTLGLVLIPREHSAINAAGELCDRWGTPFFFHAEGATRMEIRSAGPDRKMWNEDDVLLTP